MPGSSLRLLYVIDSLAPGGAERSLAALAPHYRQLGVRLEVLVLSERDGLRPALEEAGATVTALHAGNRASRLRELKALIAQRSPDLVHTTLFESDILGRPAARLDGIPVVSSLVNDAYGADHRRESGIRASRMYAAQALDMVTARLAIRMHAVSEHVRQVMSRRLRFPEERIDVVPRGRDPSVLGRRTEARRRAVRSRLDLSDDDVVVVAVARHEPAKGLDELVDAFARVVPDMPRSRLLIAGREGNASTTMRAAISAHGLQGSVVLLGARDDVPDLLCASDVFVMSSHREGMPGAVIEAAAMETPIVATDLPQVREVTGSDGALLVGVGDPQKLAEALREVVHDREASAKRVAVAYQNFERNFTINRTAAMMVGFYERAMADRRATTSQLGHTR